MRALMDQDALYLINHSWAVPWLDLVMASASSWDFWWPFLLAGGLAVLIFGGWHARMMLLVAGIAVVGVTDGIVVGTPKGMVSRPRPHEVLVGVRTLDLAKGEYPGSWHWESLCARVFANPAPSRPRGTRFLPGMRGMISRSRPWGQSSTGAGAGRTFLPASIVAYSRIYVGSHWPLDVSVLLFPGARGSHFWLTAATAACWRRWGRRWLPGIYFKHPTR